MKVKMVLITGHESGYKGSWYKTGQRHVVWVSPWHPSVLVCKYSLLGAHNGGIHERHCVELHGWRTWLPCIIQRVIFRKHMAAEHLHYERSHEAKIKADADRFHYLISNHGPDAAAIRNSIIIKIESGDYERFQLIQLIDAAMRVAP